MRKEAAIHGVTTLDGGAPVAGEPGSARVAGHFGEWLQGRMGPGGPLVLVTVACPALCVSARRLGDGPLMLDQTRPVLTKARAEAFLDRIGAPPGRFTLSAGMPPGGGAGASTAALLALALASGAGTDLAVACHAIEGATDPLMLPRPDAVLWAPREARVHGPVAAVPKAEIVGGFWGAPTATDPADLDFPDVSDLIDRLGQTLSLPELAAIASESGRRCTALRGPTPDPTPDLARDLGALGHLRAHTGSARGLIFAPGTVPPQAETTLRAAGFTGTLCFRTGGA